MTDPSDREWRARFDMLRVTDERDAPEFRSILDRAAAAVPERARPRARWPLGAALAIAAALLLAVGVARVSRKRAFVASPLSAWRSPTASLLHTTGSGLLASSALLPSVLDRLGSMSPQLKGK